jgi:hypothetical protein
MPCRISFHRALKMAKKEYPNRSIEDQKKIAKGIQLKSKYKKLKRMI